jgi:hypothetical protein
MESKVYVVGDPTTKAVIVQSKTNPDYGYVKVVQTKQLVDVNGFLRRIQVPALIHGYIGELKLGGYYANQELNGRVVIRESLTPFNTKNPEGDLKIAGSTGVVCKVNNQPIYRKTVYTDMSTLQEELIQHDNVEEIRGAFRAQQASTAAIKPNEEFSING